MKEEQNSQEAESREECLEPEDIDCCTHNFDLGPYFSLGECHKVEEVKDIIKLNKEREYGEYPDVDYIEDNLIDHDFPYSTSGIFRGQIKEWSLKPKSFRNIVNTGKPSSDAVKSLRFKNNNSDLKDFIEIAPRHNYDFPEKLSDRISIARHFGVDTPFMDWTHNVLVAAYFAIYRTYLREDFENYPVSFIYHIPDETELAEGIPKDFDSLSEYPHSAYINPYNIDRRIDRQRSAFTFHPHPTLEPEKIHVDVYIMGYNFMTEMMDLLNGLGFTYDYFFPDYAGLADYVEDKPSLI